MLTYSCTHAQVTYVFECHVSNLTQVQMIRSLYEIILRNFTLFIKLRKMDAVGLCV